MSIPLTDAKPGSLCRIVSITADIRYRQRLLEMGIVDDVEIEVIREAPLFDPREYKIGDFYLGLRKSEASKILVELITSVKD